MDKIHKSWTKLIFNGHFQHEPFLESRFLQWLTSSMKTYFKMQTRTREGQRKYTTRRTCRPPHRLTPSLRSGPAWVGWRWIWKTSFGVDAVTACRAGNSCQTGLFIFIHVRVSPCEHTIQCTPPVEWSYRCRVTMTTLQSLTAVRLEADVVSRV